MLYEAQQNDDGVDKMHQRSKRRSPAFAPGAELQQACWRSEVQILGQQRAVILATVEKEALAVFRSAKVKSIIIIQ